MHRVANSGGKILFKVDIKLVSRAFPPNHPDTYNNDLNIVFSP
jgi:hypothetical protein